MSDLKGDKFLKRLQKRALKEGKRGKERKQQGANIASEEMRKMVEDYLDYLSIQNYSEQTIETRTFFLEFFMSWACERGLESLEEITRPVLESYQRYLWRYRKKNGKPIGVSTQRHRLTALKHFFTWLTKKDHLPANPASDLELPRPEKHLPVQPLSKREMQAVLSAPDCGDMLGIRDRAILEVFYATGVRRTELTRLEVGNFHAEHNTLHVRQGKGKKDRFVPVGKIASRWLVRYMEEVRPQLAIKTSQQTLFLTSYGDGFNPSVMGRLVTKYISQAEIGRAGSCHLLRHTCAGHMLEGGADIRFIQQLLGHESIESTSLYTSVSITQLQVIHEKTHPSG